MKILELLIVGIAIIGSISYVIYRFISWNNDDKNNCDCCNCNNKSNCSLNNENKNRGDQNDNR